MAGDRWEIRVLVGPCSRAGAEDYAQATAAWASGRLPGAVVSVREWDEGAVEFSAAQVERVRKDVAYLMSAFQVRPGWRYAEVRDAYDRVLTMLDNPGEGKG